MHHDVSKEQDWIRVIDHIREKHGRLNVLINNAGLVKSADIETCTAENWRLHMSVTADGMFFGCKHAFALMSFS